MPRRPLEPLGAGGLERAGANDMPPLVLATEPPRASLTAALERLVKKQPSPPPAGSEPSKPE